MDILLRAALAIAWGFFAKSSLEHFLRTGSVVSLGILVINTVIVTLFLFRRKTKEASKRPADWLFGGIGTLLPLLLRPGATPPWGVLAGGLQLAGALLILGCILSLGRSFGIVPANRGIQVGGAYRWVRHPLYAAELFFYGAYLLGNPTGWNLWIFAMLVLTQTLRAMAEEKLLRLDEGYQQYFERVRFRFVPGLL